MYVDIEMNSLEDAYVNIAKAEESLHNRGVNINSEGSSEEFEDRF